MQSVPFSKDDSAPWFARIEPQLYRALSPFRRAQAFIATLLLHILEKVLDIAPTSFLDSSYQYIGDHLLSDVASVRLLPPERITCSITRGTFPYRKIAARARLPPTCRHTRHRLPTLHHPIFRPVRQLSPASHRPTQCNLCRLHHRYGAAVRRCATPRSWLPFSITATEHQQKSQIRSHPTNS